MRNNDKYYLQAAENAKEDYFLFSIARTEKEVEMEAERLRKGNSDETKNNNR